MHAHTCTFPSARLLQSDTVVQNMQDSVELHVINALHVCMSVSLPSCCAATHRSSSIDVVLVYAIFFRYDSGMCLQDGGTHVQDACGSMVQTVLEMQSRGKGQCCSSEHLPFFYTAGKAGREK